MGILPHFTLKRIFSKNLKSLNNQHVVKLHPPGTVFAYIISSSKNYKWEKL